MANGPSIISECGSILPPVISCMQTTQCPVNVASPSILVHTRRAHIYLGGDDRFFAIVDQIDYDFISERRWCLHHAGLWYASRTNYIKGGTRKRQLRVRVYVHREVMARAEPAPTLLNQWGKEITPLVDHINGRSLDCRRENLRWASYLENNTNTHYRTPQAKWNRDTYRKPLGQDPETGELIFEGECYGF